MLYRAVGKVLLVVPSRPAGGGPPVIPDLEEIRRSRATTAREQAPKPLAGRANERSRPRHPYDRRAGDPELARAMRPRPGVDTNAWEHDRAALWELYLFGPRREFGGAASHRRLLAFLAEQRPCN